MNENKKSLKPKHWEDSIDYALIELEKEGKTPSTIQEITDTIVNKELYPESYRGGKTPRGTISTITLRDKKDKYLRVISRGGMPDKVDRIVCAYKYYKVPGSNIYDLKKNEMDYNEVGKDEHKTKFSETLGEIAKKFISQFDGKDKGIKRDFLKSSSVPTESNYKNAQKPEEAIRQHVVEPILSTLNYQFTRECKVGSGNVDYIISGDKSKVMIEAKKIVKDAKPNSGLRQLERYYAAGSECTGYILVVGLDWLLCDINSEKSPSNYFDEDQCKYFTLSTSFIDILDKGEFSKSDLIDIENFRKQLTEYITHIIGKQD